MQKNKLNGSLAGMTITDELLLNLASIRSDGNVLPSPAMSVEKFAFPGGDVAVVDVQASTVPPVRYRGRVYIRLVPVGLSPMEIRLPNSKLTTRYLA